MQLVVVRESLFNAHWFPAALLFPIPFVVLLLILVIPELLLRLLYYLFKGSVFSQWHRESQLSAFLEFDFKQLVGNEERKLVRLIQSGCLHFLLKRLQIQLCLEDLVVLLNEVGFNSFSIEKRKHHWILIQLKLSALHYAHYLAQQSHTALLHSEA